jgi:hypothetical protein
VYLFLKVKPDDIKPQCAEVRIEAGRIDWNIAEACGHPDNGLLLDLLPQVSAQLPVAGEYCQRYSKKNTVMTQTSSKAILFWMRSAMRESR